jgi:hypothetical protein
VETNQGGSLSLTVSLERNGQRLAEVGLSDPLVWLAVLAVLLVAVSAALAGCLPLAIIRAALYGAEAVGAGQSTAALVCGFWGAWRASTFLFSSGGPRVLSSLRGDRRTLLR